MQVQYNGTNFSALLYKLTECVSPIQLFDRHEIRFKTKPVASRDIKGLHSHLPTKKFKQFEAKNLI